MLTWLLSMSMWPSTISKQWIRYFEVSCLGRPGCTFYIGHVLVKCLQVAICKIWAQAVSLSFNGESFYPTPPTREVPRGNLKVGTDAELGSRWGGALDEERMWEHLLS